MFTYPFKTGLNRLSHIKIRNLALEMGMDKSIFHSNIMYKDFPVNRQWSLVDCAHIRFLIIHKRIVAAKTSVIIEWIHNQEKSNMFVQEYINPFRHYVTMT